MTSGYSLQAQTEGSSRIVDPFESGDSNSPGPADRFSMRTSDEPESSFWLPSFRSLPKPALPKPTLPRVKLIPSWARASDSGRSGPSTWDRINNGTKSFFHKTQRVLMPWSAADEKSSRGSISSRTSGRSRSGSRSQSGTKAFFSSWFKSDEEEKEIKTVNEWLSLPTVPYD
jgi:hypothetical protein